MKKQIVETDVLIIGGGPAGFATAIHLADLMMKNGEANGDSAPIKLPYKIMLLEKGGEIGGHSISGAIINPIALKELLPDISISDMPFESEVKKDEVHYLSENGKITFPFTPPYFGNHGNYLASLGKITKWLAAIAEKKGVQIYAGFNGSEVLYQNEKIIGVRSGASGIDKHGNPMDNYQPETDIHAKITIFAEGSRGSLSKTVINKFDLAKEKNPQVYSLGVKEVWEVPEGNIEEGYVAHSLGFPVDSKQFGGGFIYGLRKNLVSIGLAVGLDYADPTFDTHHAFQIYKKHPFVAKFLKGGKIVRYGAKTIPEGGYYSIPKLYADNMMIVGDSAGLVAMPSLKGIHLGMKSGMLAAQTAYAALQNQNTSSQQLSMYEKLINESYVKTELYPVRNFRQAFDGNLYTGMLKFGTQLITGGRGFGSEKLPAKEDYKHYRPLKSFNGDTFMNKMKDELSFDKITTFDKEMDIYYSGTNHDEEQPSHIQIVSTETCQTCLEEFGAPCQRFCPADVFEIVEDTKSKKKSLTLHPSNCVHCKTCDIKDPYQNVIWNTPYGGDGPEYGTM